jgi:hypothetical protein
LTIKRTTLNGATRIIHREQKINGLLYGLFAGLAFVSTAWGIDALALNNAATVNVWAKFGAGLLICLPLGALTGWVAALFDRGLLSILLWSAVGFLFGWMAGHFPFELASSYSGLLDPRFANTSVYPLVRSAQVRAVIITVSVVGISALVGALELLFLDSAHSAASRIGGLLNLALVIPVMGMAGIAADSMTNKLLRNPIISVSNLIELAIETQGQELDKSFAAENHLSSVEPIEDWINKEHLLYLGSYDSQTLLSSTVDLDFEGNWARCSIVDKQVMNCLPTEGIYQRGLSCYIEGKDHCPLLLNPQSEEWLSMEKDNFSVPPDLWIETQSGEVAFIGLRTKQGEEFRCTFRGHLPMHLESCTPLP